MSTKIYNGYRLTAHNFLEIRGKLKSLRPKFESVKATHLQKTLTHMVVDHLDRAALGLMEGESPKQIRMNARNLLYDKLYEAEKSSQRMPPYDVKCEVLIIPCTSRKTLAILYSNLPQHERLWIKQDWVFDYGYWNNSDRPENLTKEAWRRRCLDWEEALPGGGIPAHEGFLFELCDQTMPSGLGKIDRRIIASPEERARRLAREIVTDEMEAEFIEKKTKEIPADEDGNKPMGELLNVFEEVIARRDSMEGKERAERLVKQFVPKLEKVSFEEV